MTKQARLRRLVTCATIDAILVLGASSAMAAPLSAPATSPMHVPVLLLAGISLIGVTLTRHRAQ